MKLERKHYYWIGAAALVTIVGIVVYKKQKKKKLDQSLLDEKKSSSSSKVEELEESKEVVKKPTSIFPLKMDSNNEAVKSVQKYMNSTCPSDLKKEGVYPLLLDGVWGKSTEAAALACEALKRNKIDEESFSIIFRDLEAAKIGV